MFKTSSFLIKNCYSCKHLLINPIKFEQPLCTRFILFGHEENHFKYDYAYIARSDERLCGPDGKQYVPLRKTNNPTSN
jgi:hypothetical protein